MKNTRFTFCILALIAILAGGCVGPKPVSDPMSGLTRLPDRDQPYVMGGLWPDVDKSVIEDCQSFVHSLKVEGYYITDDQFCLFQNKSGQLVGLIEVQSTNNPPSSDQLSHTSEHLIHVLIYDKNNKRIKVIKYRTGLRRYWYRY
jgi:hypothetical protein